jgi:hypothetical protein
VVVRRGRGRPRKAHSEDKAGLGASGRRRGRPPKLPGDAKNGGPLDHLGGGLGGAGSAGGVGLGGIPEPSFAHFLRSPSNFKKLVPALRVNIQDAEVLALPHGISWFTAPTPIDIHVPGYVIHGQAMVTVTVTGVDPAEPDVLKTEG